MCSNRTGLGETSQLDSPRRGGRNVVERVCAEHTRMADPRDNCVRRHPTKRVHRSPRRSARRRLVLAAVVPAYTHLVRSESSLPMTGSNTPSAQHPSTHELIVGCRDGDKASWAKLVARYETLVYTVARRNGLGPDDAADVTQTTFATLLEDLDDLRDSERLPYWLATVARRQSWRLKRRVEREPLIAVEEGFGVDPFIDWERFEVINEAMSRLGDPCRTLLTLLFFDPAQPSHAEVAERLGRALGGIGPLRGRCLDKLRSLLGEDSPW